MLRSNNIFFPSKYGRIFFKKIPPKNPLKWCAHWVFFCVLTMWKFSPQKNNYVSMFFSLIRDIKNLIIFPTTHDGKVKFNFWEFEIIFQLFVKCLWNFSKKNHSILPNFQVFESLLKFSNFLWNFNNNKISKVWCIFTIFCHYFP